MTMSFGAVITIILAFIVIISFTSYFFIKVLKTPQHKG